MALAYREESEMKFVLLVYDEADDVIIQRPFYDKLAATMFLLFSINYDGAIWAQIGEMTANGYKPIANISRDDEEEIFISVFEPGYMESVQRANVIAQYRIEEVTE